MCLTWVLTVDSSITSVARDLAVREPAGDQLEHVALARGELVQRASAPASGAGCPAIRSITRARDRGREERVARRHRVDGGDQLLRLVRLSRKPEAPALRAPKM